MIRVIAGTAGGRRLAAPPGWSTRPSSDRLRAGLFSALGGLTGARVLDLYAGTGAVGLEALSRGAAGVLLVESDPAALRVLRANVRSVDLAGALVRAQPVLAALEEPAPHRFDVAFLDPPYADPVEPALAALVRGGWLAPGATVVVERAAREAAPGWPSGLSAIKDRRYGDSRLWYGSRS
ncbi:MAG: 16S rRNA (guanine(966)-N(2))-methyltransferase RsmD [Mycobacteriales bacterium]